MGQKLGDTGNPLLVSVRSGAKFSMPGMMDTILNLGLNDTTVKALEARSGNPRFSYDCYRRFIQMYGASCSRSRRLISTTSSKRRRKRPRRSWTPTSPPRT